MKTTLELFKKKTGIELVIKDGKPYCNNSLDLRGSTIKSLPNNLVVGGSLDIRGAAITNIGNIDRNISYFLEWHNYKYIKADGIFSKVISYKGNVYKTCQIGKTQEIYLVTNEDGKWAHGNTLKEAKDDLIYKNKGEADYLPKDIHDIDTMLCKSEEWKAKSPTTLDAYWQVLITLNNMGIIPIK